MRTDSLSSAPSVIKPSAPHARPRSAPDGARALSLEGTRASPGVLTYVAYPVFLTACAAAAAYAITAGLDLETALMPIFFGIIGVLLVLERLVPFRARWQPRTGEVVRDGIYLGQGVVFGGLGQLVAGMLAVWFALGDNGLPLWLAAPLAIVLSDLCTYGFHRFVHVNRFMWREHGIHHVTDKVNTLNANTAHFLDILLNNIAAFGPLLVLGFSPEAVFIATVARTALNFGAHANIDVRLGWLNHIIMGPEHHRLHHSVELADAGNYATVLTLWDRVFGTFTWAPGRGVAQVGVSNPESFPASHRILASVAHPFVDSR